VNQLQQLLDGLGAAVAANSKPVVSAVVILVLGRIAAGWVRKITRKGLERGGVDPTLVPFVAKLTYYGLLAVVVIAALSRVGVATTSVVAIFGAAGLAVGLALQGTLANFASGVMLLVFRPFELGDYVEVGGTGGTVVEIGIFATTLKSPDNVKITVPNSQIYGSTITNFNGYQTRRIDLVVRISYDDDIQTALDAARTVVAADPRVLAEPAPQIAVGALGDSAVELVVRPWCAAADYWDLRFDLTRRLKEGLESAGCSIPYPQRDLHLHQIAG
jgi:small conductance mechanosensitive channel